MNINKKHWNKLPLGTIIKPIYCKDEWKEALIYYNCETSEKGLIWIFGNNHTVWGMLSSYDDYEIVSDGIKW